MYLVLNKDNGISEVLDCVHWLYVSCALTIHRLLIQGILTIRRLSIDGVRRDDRR